jgi:hypothetical protein
LRSLGVSLDVRVAPGQSNRQCAAFCDAVVLETGETKSVNQAIVDTQKARLKAELEAVMIEFGLAAQFPVCACERQKRETDLGYLDFSIALHEAMAHGLIVVHTEICPHCKEPHAARISSTPKGIAVAKEAGPPITE